MTRSGEFTAPGQELQLYDGAAHFEQLAQEIADTEAGDRVVVFSMSFDPSEPLVEAVLDEAHAAAGRNVDVSLLVDAYTFMVRPSTLRVGPLWSPIPIRAGDIFEKQEQALAKLEQNGVNCTILNEPARYFSHPFAGRSHIKGSVVNNTWRVGGANLNDTERSDLFVGGEDAAVADMMYSSAQGLSKTRNTVETFQATDLVHDIDDDTQLIIDAGVPGQSRILEEAYDIIDAAGRDETLLLTSQYFPKGLVLKKLLQAHERQAKVRIVRNRSTGFGLEAIRENVALAAAKRIVPAAFFEDIIPDTSPASHIKGLASKNSAIITSHNLDPLGVKLGTAEIAVVRHDERFAEQVGNMILQTTGMQPAELAS